MDLSKISDPQQLKALAYDELQKLEIAKQNLQLINQRLAEIDQANQSTSAIKPKKKN